MVIRLYLKGSAIEIHVKLLEGEDDGETLLFRDGVVPLGRCQRAAGEGDWAKNVVVFLKQDCAQAGVAGICLNDKWSVEIRQLQRGDVGDCFRELKESVALLLPPPPFLALAQEQSQRVSNLGAAGDELAIKSNQSKKPLQTLDVVWLRILCYGTQPVLVGAENS
ncbi:MAG: hypothetical protein PV344_00895, partial [Anaplasma sp.]|nr:hypothetical protein [Anaplasma sp.]